MSRRNRSAPEQIEFTADATGAVVEVLGELFARATGWVNLHPEVDSDDARTVTPSAVGALFRAPGPPIPQATLIAPSEGRRGCTPAQLGVSHGVGRPVVPFLAERGVSVPPTWTLVQDHVRRGLVLKLDEPPLAAPALDWSLRAAEELCPIPVTGGWLAEVHRG